MQGGKRLAANGVNAETKYPGMNLLTPPILPYFPKVGRWYRCGLYSQWSYNLQSINVLIASPICFSRDTIITDVGFTVKTAANAGGVARVGIYADSQPYDVSGTLYPGKLIVDSGEIVTSTIGDKIITLANPISLSPGTVVWLASIFGVAKAQCWFSSSQQNTFGSITPAAQGAGAYKKYLEYGTLPTIFPSAAENTLWNITAIKVG